MNSLIEIINIVLPVFLVIGLGYALGAIGWMGPAASSWLSKLVFYVAGPILLFRSAALTPLSKAIDLAAMSSIAVVTVLMAFAVYMACLRSAPSRRGVLAQGSVRTNQVFVGLPVIDNAFGSSVLGPAAVLIGFMVPVYNLLAVLLLALPHHAENPGGNRDLWKKATLDVLRNPLILGSMSGVLFSALSLPIPTAIDRSLDLVARMTLPAALLSVGASMDLGRVRTEIMPTAVSSFLKLIVYPAAIYLCLGMFGVTGLERQFVVLIYASPTAVVSAIMAQEMKGDEQLAASIVIGTTIASLFTLSGWIALFRLAG
jgi:predicted permease